MDEWSCPKCRDACNCSICRYVYEDIITIFLYYIVIGINFASLFRKKRGHEPTGMLAVMAKAGGFSSVSNMLDVKGAENVSNYKRVKETIASPRKKNNSEEV